MKTKAYKLAAELGVREQSLIDWLRRNGYPNARRADTIRAEVVKRARRALGNSRGADEYGGQSAHRQPSSSKGSGFRVSFADLLEDHLPQSTSAGNAASPETSITRPDLKPVMPQRSTDSDSEGRALQLRLARAEAERDEARRAAEAARTRIVGFETTVAAMRSEIADTAIDQKTLALITAERDRLLAERERLQLERIELRRSLQEALDERSSLEEACTDLQTTVRSQREDIAAKNEDIAAKSEHIAVAEDLESSIKRETAWRARALELERAAHQGGNLRALLSSLDVTELRDQARVLTALLSQRESAIGLMQAIRQVEPTGLSNLVKDRLRRVCAHPICNQVSAQDQRVVIRVEDQRQCEVCLNSTDRRWFQRMIRECGRAGVRRLLVIGGSAKIQEKLRGLSQGEPIGMRLVSADDEVHKARVSGRVESCDLLILWSDLLVPASVTAAYQDAANTSGRLAVQILGSQELVSTLARAVCNRLARNQVLQPN